MANALVAPGGRVCIVGAGSAGLAAARVMRDAGFVPTVFECGREVGGTWNFEHQTSAMYRGLRCNIPKEVMCFRSLPFPDYEASYLTHRQVHSYLVDYSIRFALRPHIFFHSTVVGINKEERGWSVDIARADQGKESHQFDAVCVANGHFTRANTYIPPGTVAFCSDGTRTVCHSRAYRVPDPYAGRRVIVVGASASGTDIALELERSGASQVLLSHNFGHRGGKFAGTIPEVPLIKSLGANGTVTFTNGQKVHGIDDILLCTGYVYDLSFLRGDVGLSVDSDGRAVEGLVSHCVALKDPTLSMIGVPYNVLPFPMFEDQAEFHAAVLRGVVSRKSLNKLHALEVEEQRNLSLPRKYLHKLMDRQWEYRRRMASLAGFPAPSASLIEVYNDSRAARRRDIRNYRERMYKVWGDAPGQWVVFEEGEDVAGKYELDACVHMVPMHP